MVGALPMSTESEGRFRNTRDHSKEFCDRLADLFTAAMRSDFPEALMKFYSHWIPLRDFAMLELRRGYSPEVLHYVPSASETTSRIYLDGLYLLDPIYRWFEGGKPSRIFYKSAETFPGYRESEFFKEFTKYYPGENDIVGLLYVNDDIGIMLSWHADIVDPHEFIEMYRMVRAHRKIIEMLCRNYYRNVRDIFDADHLESRRRFHTRVAGMLESFGSGILTPREKEIVDLIIRGHSNKSAARLLGISPGTAGIHRSNIYSKFEVQTQGELFWRFLSTLTQESRS